MEEFIEQPSANSVEVAEPQTEVQETSVNPSEVANPEPVQDAETNARYADMRRKQEYDEIRTKAESYEQRVNRMTQLMGYQSQEELDRALDEYEQEQERTRYEEAGINPDKFQELVSELPEIKQFREIQKQQEETQRFQSEANELFTEFPDLKPEQIPAEAWQLKEQKGLTLLDAYLRTSYKSLGQQKEQEAIQKLQSNALSSPGSLGGGDVQHNSNIKNLSSKDFGSLVDQVLRGERKTL